MAASHLTFPTPQTVYFDTLNLAAAENFDIEAFLPDVIIHCGALTHVDYCETHEEESFQKNVTATANLLDIARRHHIKFVFLSTDYVFDGRHGPYRENAPVNPLSVYGKHKLAAERLIQEQLTHYLILRVTNVYGDEIRQKNFIARLLRQIEAGEKLELKLPYDQYASPTNALDIARAAEALLSAGKNGIYHVAGTDYMNRVSLALKVLRYFPETDYRLIPLSTKEFNQAAPRPLYGGFIPDKLLSLFPTFLFSSVDDYLIGLSGHKK